MREAAAAVGAAIGQPDLPYVQASAAETRAALLAQGFSASAAGQLEGLARWLSTSPLASATAAAVEIQPTALEVFVREAFAPAYAQVSAAMACA
jgi:hypothetical protein